MSQEPLKVRITKFITECKRVLAVTKKPDRNEFKSIIKVSAAGIGIIGILGFLIFLIKELVFK